MAIIQIENLTFSYTNAEEQPIEPALDNVTIEIDEGEFVAVLGHNGSGKSTLAKQLNAVLLPSGGRVFVDGMDTADENLVLAIRRVAGMVFQNPDNQIVATIVEEDVAFAPENMGLPPAEIRRRVDESLRVVGMQGYEKHASHLLSGGQKQRVAIAGVLAMQPKVIVLDEPTAMLDPVGRAEVIATVSRLNRERGITVVLITHHMDEAAQAGRVIVMEHGKVLMHGRPRDIFSRVDELRQTSLGVPQTVELLYALNQSGARLDLHSLSVDECADQIMSYLEGAD